jgi:hypothetical protein
MEVGFEGSAAYAEGRGGVAFAQVSQVPELDGLPLASRQPSERSGQRKPIGEAILEVVRHAKTGEASACGPARRDPDLPECLVDRHP